MGVQAVGAYIESLRTGRNLGVVDVIRQLEALGVETSAPYIWRIEHGDISSPGARLLNAITLVVNGKLEHVTHLLLDNSTEIDGRDLARRWLHGDESLPVNSVDELQDSLQIIEAALSLRQDRARLAQLALAARRLVQERERELQK